MTIALRTPSLLRRLGSLLYEILTVAALLLLASAIVTSISGNTESALSRLLLQVTAAGMVSGYFLWCWTHGGQTLAMKTWRIKAVCADGGELGAGHALRRYLLAIAGLGLCGLGWWWALFDEDRQFLHDRLAHTRLIFCGSD